MERISGLHMDKLFPVKSRGVFHPIDHNSTATGKSKRKLETNKKQNGNSVEKLHSFFHEIEVSSNKLVISTLMIGYYQALLFTASQLFTALAIERSPTIMVRLKAMSYNKKPYQRLTSFPHAFHIFFIHKKLERV